MSDSDHIPTPDVDGFLARYAAYEERAAALRPVNKAILFAALAAAGASIVTVTFDGVGDSGQIENVEAKAGDELVKLPCVEIELAVAQLHDDEPDRLVQPLAEAIETLAYAFLEETHTGWEDNEGAFGEFTFDVAAGTITLDYNERIETSEHHAHAF